jgi:BioD-like phosphotransacetylase family protein
MYYLLSANGLREVSVVGDNENTTLEDLQSFNQGSQRFTVKVVCARHYMSDHISLQNEWTYW